MYTINKEKKSRKQQKIFFLFHLYNYTINKDLFLNEKKYIYNSCHGHIHIYYLSHTLTAYDATFHHQF